MSTIECIYNSTMFFAQWDLRVSIKQLLLILRWADSSVQLAHP